MKKIKALLTLSSLCIITSLTSCVPTNKENNNENNNNQDDNIPSKIDPIFNESKSMKGYIDTNITLDVLDGLDPITLSLITSNISLSYKIASNINEITDYYKGIEFHINFDLYSDENNFTNSLVFNKLLPSLFSDFKYTKINSNVSDFDLYYLGDGMLYATLSTFKDDIPSRNDTNAINNASREVLNVTRMDVKAIINQLGDKLKESDNNIDFNEIISTLTSTLNGVSLDIELLTNIFVKSILTFNNGGFSYSLKEEGISNLNTLLNNEINYFINNSNLGISLNEDASIINVSSLETSLTTSSFNLKIEDENALSPIIEIYLTSLNDSFNIEPIINLEEEYLYDKQIIKKVDELYIGYSNYNISEEYISTFQNLINNVTSLIEEDFKKVSNFNYSNGYYLLKENEDGTYGYLSDYENMLNDYSSLKELLNLDLNNDKYILYSIETLLDNFIYGNNHYSDYLKNNILNNVKKVSLEKYNELINTLNDFFNNKINDSIKSINLLTSSYLNKENISLDDTHSYLNELFSLCDYSSLKINNESFDQDSSSMDEEDKITSLSLDYINKFISSNLFTYNEYEDYGKNISSIISNYLTDIKKNFKNLDSDLNLFNTYSNLLIFNDDSNLENIFNFIDLTLSSQYKSNIKNEYHSLINELISLLDKKISLELDKVILEENIYKLNKEEKVINAYVLLNSTYDTYYSKYIKNNILFSKYINNFKSIEKYNKLKSLLEEELKYYY